MFFTKSGRVTVALQKSWVEDCLLPSAALNAAEMIVANGEAH